VSDNISANRCSVSSQQTQSSICPERAKYRNVKTKTPGTDDQAECQSARMSKITNNGLTRSDTRRTHSCTHMATVGVKGLN